MLADEREFPPGLQTLQIDIGAYAKRIDRPADRSANCPNRGKIAERYKTRFRIGESKVLWRLDETHGSTQFVGTKIVEESFDCGTSGFGSQIAPCDLFALACDREDSARIVVMRFERSKTCIAHEHQKFDFGLMDGRIRVEA